EREDFLHGTSAAAAGGITTIIDMPCTSIPPVNTMENLHTKNKQIQNKAIVDYGLYGGVCAQTYHESLEKHMTELSGSVMGFKVYLLSGMDSFHSLNAYQFEQVLKKAKDLNKTVLLHAEDPDYVIPATAAEKSANDTWDAYYRSRPEMAEILAVGKAIQIAVSTGAKLHIVHIGSAEAALKLPDNAKISGETCPHYLAFSKEDFEKHGSSLKTAPVVKAPGNADLLWKMLSSGRLDFVATDHAPAPPQAKNRGSVWKDYAGIPGLETFFPYLFSEGYMKNQISLQTLLKITSENAARRYNFFHQKGSLSIGKDGDFVLINPDKEHTVKGKNFFSKGKITPFEGMKLKGKIEKTILRGNMVYDAEEGITAEPGYGKWIKPKQ
ncbi:MAG TPA: amidohydrolase family protein, partial [Bacteroidales bacterium]|nr:amidohydrolase family protein [Bacteroidales bacterium]